MTLSEIRKSKNISQEIMANSLSIAVSTYCQYETGKRNIPTEIVNGICELLDVDKDDIFLPTKFTVSE